MTHSPITVDLTHSRRALVKEIRERASNQSTEGASQAIVDFLCLEGGAGPLLLKVLLLVVFKR